MLLHRGIPVYLAWTRHPLEKKPSYCSVDALVFRTRLTGSLPFLMPAFGRKAGKVFALFVVHNRGDFSKLIFYLGAIGVGARPRS